MAVLTMPFDAVSKNYQIRVVLDEVPFRFNVRYNVREGYWYLDLLNDQSEPLRMGLKIANDVPLFARMPSATERPFGDIITVDTTAANNDATRDDLGDRVLATYADADEILSALGAT